MTRIQILCFSTTDHADYTDPDCLSLGASLRYARTSRSLRDFARPTSLAASLRYARTSRFVSSEGDVRLCTTDHPCYP